MKLRIILGFLILFTIAFTSYLFVKKQQPTFIIENIDSTTKTEVQTIKEIAQPRDEKNNQSLDQELKKRIGQMIIVGFRGTELTPEVRKMLIGVQPGGVILMDYDVESKGKIDKNIVGPEQTAKLIQDIKFTLPVPPFIAVDVEGGLVNRLKPKYGFIEIPSAQEMGKESPSKTYQTALKIAQQLKSLGFNMNFAPVVDVNIDTQSPAIGALQRSFSSDPYEVVAHAQNFIKAHQEKNIIPVIKHFPGHGSAGADSNLGLVDVTDTYQVKELIPYQELEADAIMTAHIMDRRKDPANPVTLSKTFLNNLLREQLGFNGVIISDDMQMGAIAKNYGFEEALIRAVNAGADIILSSNNLSYKGNEAYIIRDTIFNAVKNGKISIAKIVKALDRVQALKKRYKIN